MKIQHIPLLLELLAARTAKRAVLTGRAQRHQPLLMALELRLLAMERIAMARMLLLHTETQAQLMEIHPRRIRVLRILMVPLRQLMVAILVRMAKALRRVQHTVQEETTVQAQRRGIPAGVLVLMGVRVNSSQRVMINLAA